MDDTTDALYWQRTVRWLVTNQGASVHGWLPEPQEPDTARSGCGLRRAFRALYPPIDVQARCRKCTGEASEGQ